MLFPIQKFSTVSINFSILFFIAFIFFFVALEILRNSPCARIRIVKQNESFKSISASVSDFRSKREPWTFSIMHTVPRSNEDLYFFNVNTVVNLVGDARLINNPAARTHAPWPSIILIGARYYQAPVRGSLPQRKTNLEFPVTSSARINDNKRYHTVKNFEEWKMLLTLDKIAGKIARKWQQ